MCYCFGIWKKIKKNAIIKQRKNYDSEWVFFFRWADNIKRYHILTDFTMRLFPLFIFCSVVWLLLLLLNSNWREINSISIHRLYGNQSSHVYWLPSGLIELIYTDFHCFIIVVWMLIFRLNHETKHTKNECIEFLVVKHGARINNRKSEEPIRCANKKTCSLQF